MNDNLKNLNIAPDPEVWTGISKSIRRRKVACYSAIVAGVALVAGAVALLWPNGSKADENTLAQLPATQSTQYQEDISAVQAQGNTDMMAVAPKPAQQTGSAAQVQTGDDAAAVNAEPTGLPFVDRYQPETKAVAAKPAMTKSEPAKSVVPASKKEPEAVETMNAPAQSAAAPKNQSEAATVLWTPNIFTPDNGDDANRTFKVVATQPLTSFRIYIYDRSGHRVFTSSDINQAWNGTYNGQRLPQGAYVYIINYSDKDGNSNSINGTVTLLR